MVSVLDLEMAHLVPSVGFRYDCCGGGRAQSVLLFSFTARLGWAVEGDVCSGRVSGCILSFVRWCCWGWGACPPGLLAFLSLFFWGVTLAGAGFGLVCVWGGPLGLRRMDM